MQFRVRVADTLRMNLSLLRKKTDLLYAIFDHHPDHRRGDDPLAISRRQT
jgi:hypothetical protein